MRRTGESPLPLDFVGAKDLGFASSTVSPFVMTMFVGAQLAINLGKYDNDLECDPTWGRH